MMQKANYLLLVIDLVNDYFRRHARLAAQRDQLVAAVNRLAAAFRQAQQPIFGSVRSLLPTSGIMT
jgi:nicotinamidase-related amidase